MSRRPSSLKKIRSTALAFVATACALVPFNAPAHAAVLFTTTTDAASDGACDVDCSLRDAVIAANEQDGADVIILRAGLYDLGVPGAGEDLSETGDLDIRDDLTIIGESAESTFLVGAQDRVFDVQAGVSLELADLTVRGGNVSGNGGGIRNAGTLSLSRVAVSGNRASGDGGGIYSNGQGASVGAARSAVTGNTASGVGGGIAAGELIVVSDSTISGNSAGTKGGGLYTYDLAEGQIANVTIANNQAATEGGGIFVFATPFISLENPVFRNSIIAGNTAATNRDCGGEPVSGGHNLVGSPGTCIDFKAASNDKVGTTAAPLDARLGPLANNGGSTLSHLLLTGSPALNAGLSCTETDQRGVSREAVPCDIGAVEVSSQCLTGGATLCLNDARFRIGVTWKTKAGQTGSGQAVQLTTDTGYFWFFNRENVELTIKVLNGCPVNNRYWVFVSGLTNVEVNLTVTDTVTGQTKTYTSPEGKTFETRLDTGAFAVCGS
jgi:predicted outer membrane repeat protein